MVIADNETELYQRGRADRRNGSATIRDDVTDEEKRLYYLGWMSLNNFVSFGDWKISGYSFYQSYEAYDDLSPRARAYLRGCLVPWCAAAFRDKKRIYGEEHAIRALEELEEQELSMSPTRYIYIELDGA